MYIQKIHIENFRLLKNVDIVLDKSLTLIVGKNNNLSVRQRAAVRLVYDEPMEKLTGKQNRTTGPMDPADCYVPGFG